MKPELLDTTFTTEVFLSRENNGASTFFNYCLTFAVSFRQRDSAAAAGAVPAETAVGAKRETMEKHHFLGS